MIWLIGAIWVAGVSLVTLLLFWWDKRQAVKGGWRVSEGTLLTLALIGGWPGAKYAQRIFRHKTQKQPFANTLNMIGVVLVVLIGVVAAYFYDGGRLWEGWVSEPELEVEVAPPLPRRFGPGSGEG